MEFFRFHAMVFVMKKSIILLTFTFITTFSSLQSTVLNNDYHKQISLFRQAILLEKEDNFSKANHLYAQIEQPLFNNLDYFYFSKARSFIKEEGQKTTELLLHYEQLNRFSEIKNIPSSQEDFKKLRETYEKKLIEQFIKEEQYFWALKIIENSTNPSNYLSSYFSALEKTGQQSKVNILNMVAPLKKENSLSDEKDSPDKKNLKNLFKKVAQNEKAPSFTSFEKEVEKIYQANHLRKEFIKNRDLLPTSTLYKLFHLAWNLFEYQDAEKFGEEILKQRKGFEKLDSLYYFMGRLYLDKKEYKKAASFFQKKLDLFELDPLHEHTLFYLGMTFHLMKEEKKASHQLKDYLAQYPDGQHVSAAYYFSDQEEKLISLKTYSYYHFLKSKGEISLPTEVKNKKEEKIAYSFSIEEMIKIKQAEEFLLLGDFSSMLKILNSFSLNEKNISFFLNYKEKVPSPLPLDAMEEYLKFIIKINPFYNINFFELYPRPEKYKVAIEKAMKELNIKEEELDPLLIFSLIRQESLFGITATSSVGAFGPMQLMSYTADKTKKKLKKETLDYQNFEDNILMGVAHFYELYQKYNKNLIYTLCAYNAGSHHLKRWIKARGDLPKEIFIELISFQETRLYVKNIFRNYFIYQLLYREKEKNLKLTWQGLFN